MTMRAKLTRRTLCATAALACVRPRPLRAAAPLELRFRTIPDPDGWNPNLRLRGDWLIFEITDGRLSGFGEASHSTDDERCKTVAAGLFGAEYAGFEPSLENLAADERRLAAAAPDFVTATAYSALNQAFYDLLAKREGVPVWQLFRDSTDVSSLPLYTTINRALRSRSVEEYVQIAAEADAQGFEVIKCAPFDAVVSPADAVAQSAAGFDVLARLRDAFPDLGLRVDFHERFSPQAFAALVPQLERLRIDWLEEPFAMGPSYAALQAQTQLPIAAGELFWGGSRFAEIAARGWADVIMPDVKHVGGFGPLLDVMRRSEGRIDVSPHNPSGPISTAASLHAAAVRPGGVRSLEYAFDRRGDRRATGEVVANGRLHLGDGPGWGIAPT